MRSTSTGTPELLFGGRFSGDRDVAWHRHDGAELVLVTAGHCTLQVGDTTLRGMPGALWILPAGVPQYQANHGPVQTTYLGVCCRGYDDHPRSLAAGLDGYVRRWMEDLVDLHASARSSSTTALLQALLAELHHTETLRGRTCHHPLAVQQALAYLEQHLTEDISIDALAGHVHLSPSHLAALFRRAIGHPPLHYQQRLRLRRAERLLANPHLSIKEIASSCGYPDTNYFVRLFRKRYGRPPGRWRQ